MDKIFSDFIWNHRKELINIKKHGVDFVSAANAFKDAKRKIYSDAKHSEGEERFFCVGKVGGKILTVRFIYRQDKIRIFGAGYWRKGKVHYEKESD